MLVARRDNRQVCKVSSKGPALECDFQSNTTEDAFLKVSESFERRDFDSQTSDITGRRFEGCSKDLNHGCFDSEFFFPVSRTRHHSCAGHCFTIRSHCNFFRNATIPPGRNNKKNKGRQHNTNQTQTKNQTPEWKKSSLFLYNIQLK